MGAVDALRDAGGTRREEDEAGLITIDLDGRSRVVVASRFVEDEDLVSQRAGEIEVGPVADDPVRTARLHEPVEALDRLLHVDRRGDQTAWSTPQIATGGAMP